MKKIKTKDIILIAVIVVLAAVLLLVGLQSRKSSDSDHTAEATQTATAEPETTENSGIQNPEASPETTTAVDDSTETENSLSQAAAEQAKAYLDEYPAESYLIVTTISGVHTPIPLNEDGAFKITFADDNYNVIHVGKNSFYMEESTCDNQNCVDEGEVTLENMDTRPLYNMVLCLPHSVILELVKPDEALERLTQAIETAAAEQSSAGETVGDVTNAG